MIQPLISNHGFLCARIICLKSKASKQEMVLKESVKEFVVSSNPISKVKSFIVDLFPEKIEQHNVKNALYTAASNFTIGKLFGKYHSVNRFIFSTIAEKIATILINKS